MASSAARITPSCSAASATHSRSNTPVSGAGPSTRAGAPSSTILAWPRVRSSVSSAVLVTPGPVSSTATMTRAPPSRAGATSTSASPPESTCAAVPLAVPPVYDSSVWSSVAAIRPSAMPVCSSLSGTWPSASAANAVARNGPGSSAAPVSSSATASSDMPAPAPPYSSGTISPDRPSSPLRRAYTCGS
ncbi:hypothetical protein ACFQQB_06475 [Nonomuraea rubra]|uniref:hypothetical protein n=1 Tax=Nonomuraea rubra TaxID=46180 RepID=UPI003622A967